LRNPGIFTLEEMTVLSPFFLNALQVMARETLTILESELWEGI